MLAEIVHNPLAVAHAVFLITNRGKADEVEGGKGLLAARSQPGVQTVEGRPRPGTGGGEVPAPKLRDLILQILRLIPPILFFDVLAERRVFPQHISHALHADAPGQAAFRIDQPPYTVDPLHPVEPGGFDHRLLLHRFQHRCFLPEGRLQRGGLLAAQGSNGYIIDMGGSAARQPDNYPHSSLPLARADIDLLVAPFHDPVVRRPDIPGLHPRRNDLLVSETFALCVQDGKYDPDIIMVAHTDGLDKGLRQIGLVRLDGKILRVPGGKGRRIG